MIKTALMIAATGLLVLSVSGQTVPAKPPKKTKKSKPEKQFITPADVFPAKGYSYAVAVRGGRTIYVAGQIALNKEGDLVGKDDVRAQTEQVFENIKAVLAAAGATFADVVKINYYVKNLKPEFLPAIREVRDRFLPKDQPPPASTLAGVQSLFRDDILIEIECVAVVK